MPGEDFFTCIEAKACHARHHMAMKFRILCLALSLSLQATWAQPLTEIMTLTGKRFVQCEIVRVDPDAVSFRHATGAARVLFTDLSPEWRQRLGYDAKRARAYAQQMEARRQQEREARVQAQKEAARREEARFQLLAAAAQRDHLRSLGQEAQARAAVERARQSPSVVGVPSLPPLGAVFTPEGIYRQTVIVPGWQIPGQPGWFTPSWGFPTYSPGWGYGQPCRPPCAPPVRTGRIRLSWQP